MGRRIIKKEMICPRCGGMGTVTDWEMGALTMGFALIAGLFSKDWRKECPLCKGKKIVTNTTIIEED